jgi:hypothetical protein
VVKTNKKICANIITTKLFDKKKIKLFLIISKNNLIKLKMIISAKRKVAYSRVKD